MRQVSLKQSQYVIYVAAAVEFVRSVKLALALVAARPLSNDRSVGKVAFGDALRKSLDGCGFEYVRRDAWSNSRLIGRERVNPNVAVTKSAGFEQLRAGGFR